MRIIFQVLHGPDGRRSAPAEGMRDEVARILSRDERLSGDELFLVLFEERAEGQWSISRAPLMRVGTFVGEFGKESVV